LYWEWEEDFCLRFIKNSYGVVTPPVAQAEEFLLKDLGATYYLDL
jgi:hypothetical protein